MLNFGVTSEYMPFEAKNPFFWFALQQSQEPSSIRCGQAQDQLFCPARDEAEPWVATVIWQLIGKANCH